MIKLFEISTSQIRIYALILPILCWDFGEGTWLCFVYTSEALAKGDDKNGLPGGAEGKVPEKI